MTELREGAALGFLRLNRLGTWWALAAGFSFAALLTLLERQGGNRAADASLTGISFGVVLPLLALFAVHRCCRGERLDQCFRDLALHGADRRRMTWGLALVAVTAAGLLGLVLGALTIALARNLNDAAFLNDLGSSATVGAFAGAGYACWFALGSRFGGRGRGRTAFFLLDWVLGSSTGALALPLPRGHVRNLLGGAPVMELSQASSGVVLGALIFFSLLLAIGSIPR
jgi:hypothetical protein